MNFIIRLYGLAVSLWFIVNQLLQDTWWLIVVLDKFANYFLILAIPFLLLSLLTRKSPTILCALLAVGVAGYFYAPLLIPTNGSAQTIPPSKIRIATYNIWNHSTDLEKVVALANSTNADVIAVQELTDVQQVEFVKLMSATYSFYHVSPQVYGGTTALFSKTALTDIQELDFNIDRPAVVADLSVGGNIITVVSAHLNPSYWAYHDKPLLEIPGNYHQYIKRQNTQAQMIIDAVKARVNSDAAVLACDCNSQETASTNRLLRTYFKDAFRSMGFQMGEPTEAVLTYERKLAHIDYVWYSGNVLPTAVYRARETVGSDHAPVLADFSIR